MRKKFYFFCALIFGIPIFTYIPFGKFLIRSCELILIFFSFYDFIKYKKIKKTYLVFYFLMFFLYFFSGILVSSENLIRNVSFLIIPIFMIILSSFLKTNKYEMESYIKGIQLISLLNCIWSFFEFGFWKFFKYKLNEVLFLKLLVSERTLSLVNEYTGKIRCTGLSWDPYFLGFFSLFTIIYSKKNFLKVLGLISLFLSESRNSQLTLVVYIIYKISKKITKKNLSYLYYNIFAYFCILVGIIYKLSNVIGVGDTRRKYYYLVWIYLLKERSIILSFLGGSFYSGLVLNSYPQYQKYFNLPPELLRKEWFIESDWINIIIGRGIIGFIMYFLLFYFLIRKKDKLKEIYIVIFILGFGYLYELYLPLLMFYIFSFNEKEYNEKII